MRTVSCAQACVLASAFFLHGSGAQGIQNSTQSLKLQFGVIPEKREYQVGEVMKFKFYLRNSGDQDVLVARRFVLNQYVWLEISGPDGKELPWCGKIDGGADSFLILRPGAKIQSVVRVSCDSHRDSGFVFDRRGTYNVSAYYHLPEPLNSLKRIAGSTMVTTARVRARAVEVLRAGFSWDGVGTFSNRCGKREEDA